MRTRLATLLLATFLAACTPGASPGTATPTPDLAATAWEATSIRSRQDMLATSNAYATAGFPPVHPGATPTPAYPLVTAWQVHHSSDGIDIEYPADWQVEVNEAHKKTCFSLSPNDPAMPNFRICLEVYDRPLSDRRIADPFSWPPNDAGFVVGWSQPIAIEAAEGVEFLWGDHDDLARFVPASLPAIYYSETFELDVRLMTDVDPESRSLFMTGGYEGIAARFAVFEHMAQSIRIRP